MEERTNLSFKLHPTIAQNETRILYGTWSLGPRLRNAWLLYRNDDEVPSPHRGMLATPGMNS